MKFGKEVLAVAFGSALGMGMAGQASADVYGLSYLNIDDLLVIAAVTGGSAGRYTFSTNQDAILNSVADPTAGNANCNGNITNGSTNCSTPSPTLSGEVQNAPPASAGVRTNGDYTAFGQVGNYSNSEAEVVEAFLTGDAKTHVESISESNLANDGGQTAQANTNILSNTTLLNLEFPGGAGTLIVSFTADIDVQTEVTGGDFGLAGASSSASLTLVRSSDGETMASWAPDGSLEVGTCEASLVCTVTETGLSLNNTSSSEGALNSVTGSGTYGIDISGLADGTYTIALASTTSTDLIRDVPVPGTLLLTGTGLLLGARAARRNKK